MMDKTLQEKARLIRLVVLDADGCLTPGHYFVSDNGVVTKSFYTRDFWAIENYLDENKLYIITQAKDQCIYEKVKTNILSNKNFKLLTGIKNKKDRINEIIKELNISWDNIAYFGDAENDLESMKLSAITGCPNDAIDKVKEESNFVSSKNGGNGCVYDFLNWLNNLTCDSVSDIMENGIA